MEKNPFVTRRQVVSTAVLLGATAALGAAGNAFAESADQAQPNESQSWEGMWHEQMGFWVDTRNCVDCGTCAHACRRANGTPENQACRRKIVECVTNSGQIKYVSVSCMHCSNPSCLTVCPAGAISKRESDGAVIVDRDRCIGCKYCYQACPFEVPHYTSEGMVKCDMCIGNGRYPGNTPACAARCPHDALHFGKIRDLLAAAGEDAVAVTGITGPSLIVT